MEGERGEGVSAGGVDRGTACMQGSYVYGVDYGRPWPSYPVDVRTLISARYFMHVHEGQRSVWERGGARERVRSHPGRDAEATHRRMGGGSRGRQQGAAGLQEGEGRRGNVPASRDALQRDAETTRRRRSGRANSR